MAFTQSFLKTQFFNEIPKSNHIKLFPFDVSDSNFTKSIFNQIKANNTHIDILINCAGSFGNIGKLEDVSPKDFILAFQSNLFGTYNMCYYSLSFTVIRLN